MTNSKRIVQFVVGLIAVILGSFALAETVVNDNLKKDYHGYPCFLELKTQESTKVSLNLSDYKDVWSISFFVANRPLIYKTFFDSRGLVNSEAFENAFQEIKIGSRSFRIDHSFLPYVYAKEIDDKASVEFEIRERHNVAAALEAMQDDGFAIPNLIDIEKTAGAFFEFRSCSLNAMGLVDGEQVETDYRAEYRMIFERTFEEWVLRISAANACGAGRYDDEAIEDVIDQAASVFYPGIFNILKRREFHKVILKRISFAELSGIIEAGKSGCFMAGNLADIARIPVIQAIEAAQKSD